MTLLYIVRHGETDYNLSGRYQGQSDLPMNETGLLQTEALARRFAKIKLDVIYTSDVARAQTCARRIAGARTTVVLEPRLREIDVGRVQGLTDEEIARREPTFWAAYQQDRDRTPFPGGESSADVQRRVLEAFRTIHERYPDGHVGVVTHGGPINMVVADVLGLPLPERRRLVPDNCGLTVVEWSGEDRRVRSFNDVGHLADALPGSLAHWRP